MVGPDEQPGADVDGAAASDTPSTEEVETSAEPGAQDTGLGDSGTLDTGHRTPHTGHRTPDTGPEASTAGDESEAEPAPLTDPDELRRLDEEFSDLEREIERIALLTPTRYQDTLTQLHQLRKIWEEKLPTDPNRPEWKKRLDKAFADALEKIMVTGAKMNPDGTLGFKLDPEVVKKTTGGLLSQVVQALYTKWANPEPATPKSQKPKRLRSKARSLPGQRGPKKKKKKKRSRPPRPPVAPPPTPPTRSGEERESDRPPESPTAKVLAQARKEFEAAPANPINFKLDLGSLLKAFIKPPTPAPADEAEAEDDAEEAGPPSAEAEAGEAPQHEPETADQEETKNPKNPTPGGDDPQ